MNNKNKAFTEFLLIIVFVFCCGFFFNKIYIHQIISLAKKKKCSMAPMKQNYANQN
jgi:hypothetical protein